MLKNALASVTLATIVSFGLLVSGCSSEADPPVVAQGESMIGAYPASSDTTMKSGVTMWNLYNDDQTGAGIVRGMREDGSLEEELITTKNSEGGVTVTMTFYDEKGNVVTKGDVVTDAEGNAKSATAIDTATNVCATCMDNDLKAASAQMGGAQKKSGEFDFDACSDAQFNRVIAGAGLFVACASSISLVGAIACGTAVAVAVKAQMDVEKNCK